MTEHPIDIECIPNSCFLHLLLKELCVCVRAFFLGSMASYAAMLVRLFSIVSPLLVSLMGRVRGQPSVDFSMLLYWIATWVRVYVYIIIIVTVIGGK